jgi:hypothetical protein
VTGQGDDEMFRLLVENRPLGHGAELADARVLRRPGDAGRSEQTPDVVLVVAFLGQESAVDQRASGAGELDRDVDVRGARAEVVRRRHDRRRQPRWPPGRAATRRIAAGSAAPPLASPLHWGTP